jgi:hypothetical protein
MKRLFRAGVLSASLFWLAGSLPTQAQGTIRYVPNVNMGFPIGDIGWDVDASGTDEFIFRFDGRSLAIIPQNENFILAYPSPPPDLGSWVVPLTSPSEIGDFDYSPIQWIGYQELGGYAIGSGFNSCTFGACVGTFVGIRASFGFSFQIDGATHFGWATFHSYSTTLPSGILEEYAYNLTPGAPIFVGQVPEPATWVLLTGGALAFAVVGRRQRLPGNSS